MQFKKKSKECLKMIVLSTKLNGKKKIYFASSMYKYR